MTRLDKVLQIARKFDFYQPQILDIGCSKGDFSKQLGGAMGATAIFGVERDKHRAVGVTIVHTDIREKALPFDDGIFDVIFAGNMLDIVPDPDFLLKEIKRLLGVPGTSILTFPSLDWWANKVAILLGFQPYGDRPSTEVNVGKLFIKPRRFSEKNAGYFHHFSRRAFRQLAEFYGFRVKFHTLPWQRFSIVTLEKT
jgi:SAM-dependent methyltransferase